MKEPAAMTNMTRAGAIRIVFLYAVFGALWILLSDLALA